MQYTLFFFDIKSCYKAWSLYDEKVKRIRDKRIANKRSQAQLNRKKNLIKVGV